MTSGMSKKKPDKSKKNTSLRLDESTLKALKLRALEDDSSVQAIIEQLINDYLANRIKLKKKR